MSLKEFINTYTSEIDTVIRGYGIDGPIDNWERELWIRNDESLYNWAKRAGVSL